MKKALQFAAPFVVHSLESGGRFLVLGGRCRFGPQAVAVAMSTMAMPATVPRVTGSSSSSQPHSDAVIGTRKVTVMALVAFGGDQLEEQRSDPGTDHAQHQYSQQRRQGAGLQRMRHRRRSQRQQAQGGGELAAGGHGDGGIPARMRVKVAAKP
jgi:hypothetical protein